jgi:hypothetical protein
VLLVEDDQGIRQCDLRTASWIQVGTASAVGSMPRAASWARNLTTFAIARNWSATTLQAWPEAGDGPVQLVLAVTGPSDGRVLYTESHMWWVLLTEGHLRLLAQVIRSRPGPDKDSRAALRSLDRLARYQEVRPDGSWDWSFRSDPQGLNREAGPPKADGSG